MSLPKGKPGPPPNSSVIPQQVLQIQQTNYPIGSRGIPPQGSRLEEHYGRSVTYTQSVRPSLHPNTLASSNIAHDMNKPPFAQPGLPGSTPTQQAVHHSSAPVMFPGQQVPGRQQSSSHSGAQVVGHAQLQYFPRSAAPRQIQNMPNQRQSVPLGLSMSSGNQSGYFSATPPVFMPSGHVQQVSQSHIIYQHHPTSSMATPVEYSPAENHSVPIVPSHTSLRYPMENGEMNAAGMPFRYQAIQPYSTQGNPQILYSTQVPAYQNPYYPQMINVATPNRTGVVQAIGAVQQQAPQSQREKRYIQIVDPNTQRDLTEEILANSRSNNPTPPNSGSSSARATPPSNATPPLMTEASDIPAQFARQVAAVASSTGPLPSFAKEVRQTQQPQHQPPVIPSASVPPHLTPVLSCDDNSTVSIEELDLRNQSLLGKGPNIPSMNGNSQAYVDKSLEAPTQLVDSEQEVLDNGRLLSKPSTVLCSEELSDKVDINMSSDESDKRPEVPVVGNAAFSISVGSSAVAATSTECQEPESIVSVPQLVQPFVAAQPQPPPPQPSRVHPTVGGPEFTYQGPPPSTPPFPLHKASEVVPRPQIKDSNLPISSAGALPTFDKIQSAVPSAPQPPQLPPPPLNPPGSPAVYHFVQDQTIIGIPTSTAVPHAPPSHTMQAATRPTQPALSAQRSAQPVVTTLPPSGLTKQNGEAVTESAEISADVKDSDTSARDPKNKKGKKKGKETNRRGEAKEGGEMDAFLDKEPTVPQGSAPAQVAALTIVPKQDNPVQPEKVQSEEIQMAGEDADMEEQRKVAEKNEENAKVSKGLEQKEQDPPMINKPELPAKVLKSEKYNYKEDQWSPLNPEGKMQYDREFLLQLQEQPMSQKRPDGLPDLEIIKDSGGKPRGYDYRSCGPLLGKSITSQAADVFTPTYVSAVNTTRPRPNGRASLTGRKEQQSTRKVFNLSFQNVKLHESIDAWRPTHKQVVPADVEADITEKLYRKVRAMLNKLTPQNFGTLMNQVSTFEINNQERLSGVIDLVFEKAIDEPNFSVAYANMCKKLSALKVTSQGNEVVNFKKLMITKCQREFEKDVDDELMRSERLKKIELAETEEKKKELHEELEEAERKSKRRYLGNIRFIGELFKLSVLTPNIMHDCLIKLLDGGDEDSIECLCRLLTTIGKDLEKGPSTATNKSNQPENRMEQYFKRMREIVDKRQLSSRVRFMVQDVIDLRQQNWIPRRDENNPKTIDQIHREVEKEQMEIQAFLQQPLLPVKRQDDRDRRNNSIVGGGKRGGINESDGWNTVSSSKRTTPSVDPGKIKINRPQDVDENSLSLGPQRLIWARGSSGGVKSSSQEGERPLGAPGNRFSALAGGEHSSTMDSRRNTNRHTTMSLNRDSSKGRGTQLPPVAQRSAKPVPSKEREQAIACVKNISGNESRYRSSTSRDNSVTREIEKKESETHNTAPEHDRSVIEAKTEDIINEFLHNIDFKEAVLSVKEICSANTMPYFVTATVNRVLERSPQARQHVGELFRDLVKDGTMTTDQFNQGLEEILEVVEDYLIDLPMFWEYLAQLLSPLFLAGVLPLQCLRFYVVRLPDKRLASKLFANLLTVLSNTMTKTKIREAWDASGLQFSDFMPDGTDVNTFLAENKLEFLKGNVPSMAECLPINFIQEGLKRELQTKYNNESLFDWINGTISEKQQKERQFIRALVSTIADRAIKTSDIGRYELDADQFSSLCTVIKRYVDNEESLESETLYALQAIVQKLQHPPGLLLQFFRVLFFAGVLSEEAFIQWSVTDSPREIEGHAVAVKSVNHFLDSLSPKDQDDDDA